MTHARNAYEAVGAAWESRPARAYRTLAAALWDTTDVAGKRVLDVGAGTGVAGAEALARGASGVVAADSAWGMLAQRPAGIPAVVSDAVALPFADGAFDVAVASFVLGHLDDPEVALAETRRVAAEVVASSFDASWAHPAKAAVDAVMVDAGFTVPGWYLAMKAGEDRVADPAGLTGLARAAGYDEVRVSRHDVTVGLSTAEDLVGWRWGMAHLAPFVATLDQPTRSVLHDRCLAAVAGMPPVVMPMLALNAR